MAEGEGASSCDRAFPARKSKATRRLGLQGPPLMAAWWWERCGSTQGATASMTRAPKSLRRHVGNCNGLYLPGAMATSFFWIQTMILMIDESIYFNWKQD